MSIDNLDKNKDWYIESSEVKKMKKFLKSSERTKLLAESLHQNEQLKLETKTAFERTIKEIQNWNSNLSVDEQIVIFRSYKDLFGKEFELSDEIKENMKQNMDNLNKTIVSELKTMETIF